jgi:hypothetical protein
VLDVCVSPRSATVLAKGSEMKRTAFFIHARCILNGCDYRATLWLRSAEDANEAIKRYVRRYERNSMRVIEVRNATDAEITEAKARHS